MGKIKVYCKVDVQKIESYQKEKNLSQEEFYQICNLSEEEYKHCLEDIPVHMDAVYKIAKTMQIPYTSLLLSLK